MDWDNREMTFLSLTVAAAVVASAVVFAAWAEAVVVYSTRDGQLIKPLFDLYTCDSGVQTWLISGSEGPLMARLKTEGLNTTANMLLTVDVSNLWQASHKGLAAHDPVQVAAVQRAATPT